MIADSYDIARLSHDTIAETGATRQWHFTWGHGWGQNRNAMSGLAQSLTGLGDHVLLDFPGFGNAPAPDQAWSTADYADLTANFLRASGDATLGRRVWIGHSFGGRVGIQLAARHPQLVDRLVLIASAGLPRNRSLADQARVTGKVYTFKALKRLAPALGMDVDKLRDRFGSADYKSAGELRETLMNVVREDLSDVAARISCPTCLIYGGKDTETPPEIGERLARIIPHANLTILQSQDHYSLLGEGRHQVAKRVRDFLITEA